MKVSKNVKKIWAWVSTHLLKKTINEVQAHDIKVSATCTSKVAPEPAQFKTEPATEITENAQGTLDDNTQVKEDEEVLSFFVKGKFSKKEVEIIKDATFGIDPKEVNWKILSTTLNRKVNSLKSKAKQLNK